MSVLVIFDPNQQQHAPVRLQPGDALCVTIVANEKDIPVPIRVQLQVAGQDPIDLILEAENGTEFTLRLPALPAKDDYVRVVEPEGYRFQGEVVVPKIVVRSKP